ncbi:lipoprotein 17-related variable surface protein [Mycoplasmopsis gallopavonis]|uniref:ECM-binding protein homolog n=1 Tax=Mycoplasmopsis gallopavonis TaxID=76629 RepID=A0A449AYJ6_9BACT|nr:lipoprotein 17-related variable surface protein [Mycoplasmopsis gallopavonis]RIV16506.1 hypothetical protein D1113_02090 [Mycoplasmopsis gallopavonis]VEU72557.1 ECM-binding protein homolog [Mycoplasmopsis gallopavonis]
MSAIDNNLDQNSQVEIVYDASSFKFDDVNGKVQFSYVLKSTKQGFETLTSEKRTALVDSSGTNKFKTEQDRINELAQSYHANPNSILITGIDQAKTKPSKVQDSNVNFNRTLINANDKANLSSFVLSNKDDVNGTIDASFTIASTKTATELNTLDSNFSKPSITATKTKKLTGFYTNARELEDERKRVESFVPKVRFDYPNKQDLLADYSSIQENAVTSQLLSGSPLASAHLKVINLKITNKDDRTGQVRLSYVLQSTDLPAAQITVNPNLSNFANTGISGFKTEQQRINELVRQVVATYLDASHKAVEETIDSEVSYNSLADASVESKNPTITARNAAQKSITVSYKVKSTREGFTDIYAEGSSSINGFLDEAERLNSLINNPTNYPVNIDYSQPKANIKASEVQKEQITKVLGGNNSQAQIVIKSLSANDQTGDLTITYALESTKSVFQTNKKESTATKTITLSGFKTLKTEEQDRLNSDQVTVSVDANDKANIQASSINSPDSLTWTLTSTNPQAQIINKKVVGYDEITGTLKVSYQLESTKSNLNPSTDTSKVQSEVKYALIQGFKTEEQRLRELIKQNLQISQNSNDLHKLPSSLTVQDFSITKPRTGYENTELTLNNPTNLNDDLGTASISYKLKSSGKNLVSNMGNDSSSNPNQEIAVSSDLQNFGGYLTNTQKETERLQGILDSNLKISYSGNKEYLPLFNQDQVVANNLVISRKDGTTLDDQNIIIESKTITKRDDSNGTIETSYKIVSKTNPNAFIEVTSVAYPTQTQIDGFKTEQNRLDELVLVADYANKENISATDATNQGVSIANTNDNFVEVQNLQITQSSDLNQSISGTYVLKSTRRGFENLVSQTKTFTINGLQDEVTRLNNLLNSPDVTKTISYNDSQTAQNSIKASAFKTKFDQNNKLLKAILANQEANKAQIQILSVSANDESGELIVNYVLESTKTEFNSKPRSLASSITLSGFLTNVQEAQNDLIKEIEDAKNKGQITEKQAKDLIDKTKSQTTESGVENVKNDLNRDIKVNELTNNIDQTYPNLNPKQKEDLKTLLASSTSAADAQTKFNSYSPINDQMGQLKNEITKYEELKSQDLNQKYSKATETLKNNFDKLLTAAKELLTSTTNNGQDSLAKLIDTNKINEGSLANAWGKLDGEINVALEKLNENSYLNNQEIEKFREKLNNINPLDDDYQTEIQNLLDKAKNANDAKKEKIDLIDQLDNLTPEQKQLFKEQIKNINSEFNDQDNELNETTKQELDKILVNAEKQNLINQISDSYENLNPKQKEELKEQIAGASSTENAKEIFANASDLDEKMKTLKELVETYKNKNVDQLDDYKYASKANKDRYDAAIQSAEELLTSTTNNGSANPSLTTLIGDKNTPGSLDNLFNQLDGLKNQAINAINELKNLNDKEKQNLINEIRNIDNNSEQKGDLINAIVDKANNINDVKTTAIEKLNQIPGLTEAEKAKYAEQIKNVDFTKENQNPSPEEQVANILKEAEKQSLKNQIDQLPHLNQNQKDAYKALINADTSPESDKEVLNNAIKYDELKGQAEELKKQLEDYKQTPDYKLADPEFKNSFDEALDKLTREIADDSHAHVLDDLQNYIDKANKAKDQLNGNENLEDIKKEIQNLDHLDYSQKQNLIDIASNQDNLAEAEKIKELADSLNTNLVSLEELIKKSNETKAKTIYLLEEQNVKTDFDQKLTDATDKQNSLKNIQITPDNYNSIKEEIARLNQEALAAGTGLQNALDHLDGNRKDLANKLDQFELIETKTSLKEQIFKDLPKEFSKEELKQSLENYLNVAKATGINQVENFDHLTRSEKDALIQKIENAALNSLDVKNPDWIGQNGSEKFDKNVNDILVEALASNNAKNKALDEIDKLNGLNDTQKQHYKNEVINNPTSEVDSIVKLAKELETAMKKYRNESFATNPISKTDIDYTQADQNKKTAFDNVLTNQEANTNKTSGPNLTLEEVQKLHKELLQAREDLDGEERLNQAKTNAKNKIDQEYNNLTASQKEAAKQAIDNNEVNTIEKVEALDKRNSALDSATKLLNDFIASENEIKSHVQYSGSEEALRNNYDQALNKGKELATKLNENQNPSLLDLENLQAINKSIQDALDKLNGEENLRNVQNDANNQIDSLEDLNQAQKDALKQKISEQNTPENVRDIVEKAKELNDKMNKLNELVNTEHTNNTKQTENYQNADNTTDKPYKDNYDSSLQEAEKVAKDSNSDKDSKTALLDPEKVDKLIEDLKNSINNLNGDQKLAKAKEEATKSINDLQNLNDAQKQDLLNKVNDAKLVEDVENLAKQAKNLDDAMKDLGDKIAEIKKEIADNPIKYDQADSNKKSIYDQKLKEAEDLIKNSGKNLNEAEVNKLQEDLDEAQNNLNGESNFANEKQDEINKINEDPNLTPAQKDALIDKVRNATNKEELDNWKEKDKNLSDKMAKLRETQENAKDVAGSDVFKNANQNSQDRLTNDIKNNDDFIAQNNGDQINLDTLETQIDQLIKQTETDIQNLKAEAEEKLTNAKNKATEDLNSLTNLNNAQKDALSNAIQNATLIEGDNSNSVSEIIKQAKDLNTAMKELNDYIELVVEQGKNNDPKNSSNYQNADKIRKTAFDNSYQAGMNLVDKLHGANLDREQTRQTYIDLRKDFEALNGDQNKALATAELEKLVHQADDFKSKHPYVDAPKHKKDRYNEAIKHGQDILNNPNNYSASQVQEAIDRIKDAIREIYDNKEDIKNNINDLNNLSESEKQHFKDLIDKTSDPKEREKIYEQAKEINKNKQDLIDLVNSKDNLSNKDKQQLIDKIIKTDSNADPDWFSHLQDQINQADQLVKELIDQAQNPSLTNQEIDDLIKHLNELGIHNLNYENLAQELKYYNDVSNALRAYQKASVENSDYQELKDNLIKAIETQLTLSYDDAKVREAQQLLANKQAIINQIGQTEINLVTAMLDSNEANFNKLIDSLNLLTTDSYQEFKEELKKEKYFEIMNKPRSEVTKEDIQVINNVDPKDSSNVIYSALKQAIKTKVQGDRLSVWWWITLSLATLGLGAAIYFLVRNLRK